MEIFFNLFNTGLVPTIWLKSVINPIPKGANKDPYICAIELQNGGRSYTPQPTTGERAGQSTEKIKEGTRLGPQSYNVED